MVENRKVVHGNIDLLYNSFIERMQLCRNTEYLSVMVGNATDYIETIALVFPA